MQCCADCWISCPGEKGAEAADDDVRSRTSSRVVAWRGRSWRRVRRTLLRREHSVLFLSPVCQALGRVSLQVLEPVLEQRGRIVTGARMHRSSHIIAKNKYEGRVGGSSCGPVIVH